MKPVIIVGAGPVGLTTALALQFYGLPVLLFEEDEALSRDTKAGTILTRTLEAFRRYGVADEVLANALRVEDIGGIDLATNQPTMSVRTALLSDDTRYPFVINLPQHHLEPILSEALGARQPDALHLNHRLHAFQQTSDGVMATFETPDGLRQVEGSYLLACDGGRSTVRGQLDIPVEGVSLDVRYMLVDLKLDLDVANPRDYPYLAYFSDPNEWMVLVRQPHCWRFLYPLAPGAEPPSHEEFAAKVRRFIGEVDSLEVINTVVYRVHHRIASEWRRGRVFLMGDAAHLITPMWALGLNTGILDAISLPWRLAWIARGWATDNLLDGYAREQRPLAIHGSGEMAEVARKYMGGEGDVGAIMSGSGWGVAATRTLLGVRLGTDESAQWSMVKHDRGRLLVGDRMPDFALHGGNGRPCRLHDLIDYRFIALYFTDARRRPSIPQNRPGLAHFVVSRWDAPLDSGLRDQSLLDVGDRLLLRVGCPLDTLVLIRPDDHVAAIMPMREGLALELYREIVGKDANATAEQGA
ncbi:FAD-dependent monooxygenase [Bradyrhizobium sp. KB893862 SZCCT0404]|uniref:FAD-dependent monooxygenase n=1 Tax=Bradyrhizobium sp. KB893862 SZCCT0404 TaxID=2807672 RepID=UPI001BABFC6B|nr:FAD-dependent monooxygenase [Bradyrhizobium sp. KB893862 SZCCT0404]MBR1177212.1 FAD-dependent monooxygenase [Bradyrhizobium sp. KB893862 SZCCT0404]